jgi:hypothetical protein
MPNNSEKESKRVAPLLKTIETEQKQAEEQAELKEAYGIKKQDVVVVEKKNAAAQVLRAFGKIAGSVLRKLAAIILILLAIIGLASLVYPNIRAELLYTFNQLIGELKGYINL